MGTLLGCFLGGLFWVWLFSKIAGWLGVEKVRSIWVGYLLTVAVAVTMTYAINFSSTETLLYAAFGFMWALVLARRTSKRDPAATNNRRCRECDASVVADAEFCTSCSARLRGEPCGKCRTVNTLDSAFCKSCGNQLRRPDMQNGEAPRDTTGSPRLAQRSAQSQVAATNSSQRTSKLAGGIWVCRGCGSVNERTSVACTSCGGSMHSG